MSERFAMQYLIDNRMDAFKRQYPQFQVAAVNYGT